MPVYFILGDVMLSLFCRNLSGLLRRQIVIAVRDLNNIGPIVPLADRQKLEPTILKFSFPFFPFSFFQVKRMNFFLQTIEIQSDVIEGIELTRRGAKLV